MKKNLEYLLWDEMFVDKSLEEAWDTFLKIIRDLIERYVPKKGHKKKHQPWVNKEVKDAVRHKNKAWKDYKKNNGRINWEEFKRIRNDTNRIVFSNKKKLRIKNRSRNKG